MDWGIRNRISRIIRPHDNKTVMLAIDHGYFLGPTEKLENPRQTVQKLEKFCDSIMLTRGILRNCVNAKFTTPMVLRISGGSSIISNDLSNEKITTSIKEAIRLNSSAVALSIFIGSKHEHNSLINLGNTVNEAEEFGMPVLAVTAVGKELEKRDSRYLALACRIAAEFGAHIVKTYYCEGFEKVVSSCPIPIIIAGGPKLEEKKALELTHNAIRDGASGVDMGRNIWQSDHPIEMIKAVRSIVHGNKSAKDAYDSFKRTIKN